MLLGDSLAGFLILNALDQTMKAVDEKQTIVLVKRKNKVLIPNGNMVLHEGDRVFLYTQLHLSDANDIEI